jgi:hypothetical protein
LRPGSSPPDDPAELARRQRCRALELAGVLGVVLALFGAYERNWISVVAGLVGALVVLAVYRRTCRDAGRESDVGRES